jgi:hypothetical protein
MDPTVIASDKVLQYVYVSVRVFVRKILVQLVPNFSVSAFHNRAFDIRIHTDMKLYALAFKKIWK